MSKVFTINFSHGGNSFNAMVSITGNDESPVKIVTNKDTLEIILPNGKLSYSLAEIVKGLYSGKHREEENEVMYLTHNISLHLLSKTG